MQKMWNKFRSTHQRANVNPRTFESLDNVVHFLLWNVRNQKRQHACTIIFIFQQTLRHCPHKAVGMNLEKRWDVKCGSNLWIMHVERAPHARRGLAKGNAPRDGQRDLRGILMDVEPPILHCLVQRFSVIRTGKLEMIFHTKIPICHHSMEQFHHHASAHCMLTMGAIPICSAIPHDFST